MKRIILALAFMALSIGVQAQGITASNGTVVVKQGTVSITGGATITGGTITALTSGTISLAPSSSPSVALSISSTTAYTNALIASASAANLYGITGYNSSGSGQWIQIHNSASIPANASVPIITFYVPAGANFSYNTGGIPVYFSSGIVWSNSSTGPTKTIGSSDVWANVTYK